MLKKMSMRKKVLFGIGAFVALVVVAGTFGSSSGKTNHATKTPHAESSPAAKASPTTSPMAASCLGLGSVVTEFASADSTTMSNVYSQAGGQLDQIETLVARNSDPNSSAWALAINGLEKAKKSAQNYDPLNVIASELKPMLDACRADHLPIA